MVRVQPRERPVLPVLAVLVLAILLLADQVAVPRGDAPAAAKLPVGRVRQLVAQHPHQPRRLAPDELDVDALVWCNGHVLARPLLLLARLAVAPPLRHGVELHVWEP